MFTQHGKWNHSAQKSQCWYVSIIFESQVLDVIHWKKGF